MGKYIIALVIVIAVVMVIVSECSNPTTTYYYNGEPIWYEDNDGVHTFDHYNYQHIRCKRDINDSMTKMRNLARRCFNQQKGDDDVYSICF